MSDYYPCTVIGCTRPQRTRGLCRKHYARLLRTGTTADPKSRVVVERYAERDALGHSFDPADPRHGTTNGYSNLDCRCLRCTNAFRVTHAAYMHSDPERMRRHREREAARRARKKAAQIAAVANASGTDETS